MATEEAPYDFWLFDLDGTLVDVEWDHARGVFDRVGDRLGYRFDDRQVDVLWHGLGGPRNEWLREWGLDPDAFWEAFHAVEDAERRADATYLYDDAAVVADIDAPVGVVTHCQAYLTDAVLERFDIGDWFDAVVCCDARTGWKPDPEPVERAMDAMGVGPEGTGALVGDGPHDVGAAWNAGLDGIHIERHGPDARRLCVLGDHRITSLAELPLGTA